jgi:RNA polymerase sigma factor for flagellar operon FliA
MVEERHSCRRPTTQDEHERWRGMLTASERFTRPKPIVLAERWRRYGRDRERVVRDELVLAYSPLVKHVAGRMAASMPAHVELADLISYGLGGLIDAVERYDPARGVTFENFAGLRIRGAIVDVLRTQDWVPRAVRQEARAVEQASLALVTRLQRLPTEPELAVELGLDAAGLDDALQRIATSQTLALDEPRGPGGDITLLDSLLDPAAPDPAVTSAGLELRERIAAAVALLSGRDQTLMGLRYHQELTFAEIGQVLSLTQSRVCQLHAKCVLQLGALLGSG